MIIKKQFLKSRPVCKVTFGLPGEMTNDAVSAHLVGEFNNWVPTATPMKKLKDGSFTVTIDLEKGKEYQFRYLIDQTQWENAWNADKYVPTPFGDAENSIVVV
ncbi:MAG: isoamylase early set domain-containing protein [Deltaproteobacteria bacterium]|nr:isoamylase early set domain-containing protein [Deltaproteobacteria bacterium]